MDRGVGHRRKPQDASEARVFIDQIVDLVMIKLHDLTVCQGDNSVVEALEWIGMEINKVTGNLNLNDLAAALCVGLLSARKTVIKKR